MRKLLSIVAATITVLIAPQVLSAEFRCPLALESTKAGDVPAAAGWRSFVRTPSDIRAASDADALPRRAAWAGLSVFDGAPEEMADLVPDNPGDARAVWTFDSTSPRHVWLACTYRRTSVFIARELSSPMQRCTSGGPGEKASRVVCN